MSQVSTAVAALAVTVERESAQRDGACGIVGEMYRVVLLAALVACGDNERPGLALDAMQIDAAMIDASVDAPPPVSFDGQFDEPSDFLHASCSPGSLAGFAVNAVWPGLPLRTAVEAGELVTYIGNAHVEDRVEPLVHTDDALLVRAEQLGQLVAIYVCAAAADGRIRGSEGTCTVLPDRVVCYDTPFDLLPIARLPGEAEGEHLVLRGEIGAEWQAANSVRVRGTTAYVTTFGGGVHVVDVADPAHPVERSHIVQPGEYANDIELTTGTDGRLYAITASSPCNVIDVTDPMTPVLVATLPFPAHTLWITDGIAYLVTGGSSKLDMWNVANPRAPLHLATWTHPAANRRYAWHDVTVVGDLAYLADQLGGPPLGTGVHVVDVSNPLAVQLGAQEENVNFGSHTPAVTTTSAGQRLVLESSEWAGEGLRILDGASGTPGFLQLLGTWVLRPDTIAMHEVTPIGDRAFISHYRDGVRVLDISDPTTPLQVGYFNTWRADQASAGFDGAFALDVDPVTRRIYVADARRGLVILEGDDVVFPLSSAR